MDPLKKNKQVERKYIFNNETKNISPDYSGDLDLPSIAEWIACGFFLGDQNFTKVKYGSNMGYSFKSNWYYEPREISFEDTVDEFAFIFEMLIKKRVQSKNIILPLSGGLDSRTLAASLQNTENIFSYSYELAYSNISLMCMFDINYPFY